MNILVIVCNNGLGHIRRVLSILKTICTYLPQTIHFDVCVNLQKMNAITCSMGEAYVDNLSVTFYDIVTDGEAYEDEFISRYRTLLDGCDFVWSDNLLFPLKYRTDLVVTGTFLWSDMYPDRDYFQEEKELLCAHRPWMIANRYFATPLVQQMTHYHPVGMYAYFTVAHSPDYVRDDILISWGRAQNAQEYFSRHVGEALCHMQNTFSNIKIYIEPSFYDVLQEQAPIMRADFTEDMYAHLVGGIIRPGIGTISDMLTKGGRIFAVSEPANYEGEYNSRVLEQLGVGERCSSFSEACERLASYMQSKERQQEHWDAVQRLEFSGIEETAVLLEQIFTNTRKDI